MHQHSCQKNFLDSHGHDSMTPLSLSLSLSLSLCR